MSHDFRNLIGRLNIIGQQRALSQTLRRFTVGTAKLFRSQPEAAKAQLEGMAETVAFLENLTSTFVEPQQAPQGGTFDVLDLRHWLVLAQAANVPHIPAKTILTLSEDELSALCQPLTLPKHMANGLQKAIAKVLGPLDTATNTNTPIDADTLDRLVDRLFDAMDEVPSNWMVRSHLAGSSTLKAFAGAGVIASGDDTMQAGQISIGPGWVQKGNRRRVDATDHRFVETFAAGHRSHIHYLARPWVTAGRRVDTEDPHRHGTPFAGKGSWPMEWRVFVAKGKVTGVACYYAWAGSVTPENARKALEAKTMAERMIAQMQTWNLVGVWPDLELFRTQASEKARSTLTHKIVRERFPKGGLHATLDFIETENGMMFLEAGPAHTPIGGGHCCAFAGMDSQPQTGLYTPCEGVAFTLMDGVVLADPKTWKPTNKNQVWMSLEDAQSLANT